jgi:hypothetical protein
MSYVIRVDGVDVTDVCPEESIELGGQATIEATTGEITVDDDSGTTVTAFVARKIVTWVEDATSPDTTLARGRVEPIDYARGTLFSDDSHQKKVMVSDQNSHLRGIIVDGWVRPAESDYARVLALRNAFLHGSSSTSPFARNSTDLATTYIVNANTVTMPANTYNDTDPASVLDDCIRASNKVAFVTVDNELFYAVDTYTGYAANLAIRDDTADTEDGIGTIWAPDWTGRPGSENGQELLSGAKLKYGNGKSVIEHRSGIASLYDKWEETVYDDGAKGATDAATRLSKILDARQQMEKNYACSIEMDETQVDKIKVGQTLTFRAAAANVRSPVTVRVARLTWEVLTAGPPRIYRANLELSKPKKLGAYGAYGDRGATEIIARENAGNTPAETDPLTGGSCATPTKRELSRQVNSSGVYSESYGNPAVKYVESAVYDNSPYTGVGCPIGGGGWSGWSDRAIWWEFTAPADDPTYFGLRVTVDMTAMVSAGGFAGGFTLRLAHGAGAANRWGAGSAFGALPPTLAATIFDIPRSLIDWGAVNSLIIEPDWQCCRDCFFCNGVANFSFPVNDGRGQSNNYHDIDISTLCPVRFLSGTTGSSGWVSGYGAVDGVNRTFKLIGWDGTGVVEASINGLIQPNSEVTLDVPNLQVVLDTPPPTGAIPLFLYKVVVP